MNEISLRLSATPAQVIFRFAIQVGMMPLTGTTDPTHMEADLSAPMLSLTPTEMAEVDRVW